jgi:hypothetical protein
VIALKTRSLLLSLQGNRFCDFRLNITYGAIRGNSFPRAKVWRSGIIEVAKIWIKNIEKWTTTAKEAPHHEKTYVNVIRSISRLLGML